MDELVDTIGLSPQAADIGVGWKIVTMMVLMFGFS